MFDAMYRDMVKGDKKMERGQVWCKTCGRTLKVDSVHCLKHGWPVCCGHTMTLDAPEERDEIADPEV